MSGGRRAATMGSAFHAYMKPLVDGSETPDAKELATAFQVDLDELAMICRWGKNSWQSMRKFFPDAKSEFTMGCGEHANPNGVLTGTADVVSFEPYRVSVLDWKSGWGDGDYEQQLRGYAYLALRQEPDAQEAYCVVMHVRRRRCKGYLWRREELDEWHSWLMDRVKDETYVPGAHCRYCPRSLECPAKEELLRQSVGTILPPGLWRDDVAKQFVESLPKDPIGRGTLEAFTLERLRVIRTAVDLYEAAIRADVAAHGGELPTHDSRVTLKLVEEVRRPLDGPKAIPIIEKYPAAADWRKACRVSKTELQKIVKAPRGQKKYAVAEILEALDAGGAMLEEKIEKLTIRRNDARDDDQTSDE
jgi:hypothetical protein